MGSKISFFFSAYLTVKQLIDCRYQFPDVTEYEQPHNTQGDSCQSALFLFQEFFIAVQERITSPHFNSFPIARPKSFVYDVGRGMSIRGGGDPWSIQSSSALLAKLEPTQAKHWSSLWGWRCGTIRGTWAISGSVWIGWVACSGHGWGSVSGRVAVPGMADNSACATASSIDCSTQGCQFSSLAVCLHGSFLDFPQFFQCQQGGNVEIEQSQEREQSGKTSVQTDAINVVIDFVSPQWSSIWVFEFDSFLKMNKFVTFYIVLTVSKRISDWFAVLAQNKIMLLNLSMTTCSYSVLRTPSAGGLVKTCPIIKKAFFVKYHSYLHGSNEQIGVIEFDTNVHFFSCENIVTFIRVLVDWIWGEQGGLFVAETQVLHFEWSKIQSVLWWQVGLGLEAH